jgi:hypothetical protein
MKFIFCLMKLNFCRQKLYFLPAKSEIMGKHLIFQAIIS